MNAWDLLTKEQWEIVSAIGTAAAAVIAALGLGFVGLQIREARKSSDIQALSEFLRGATEREEALLVAQDDAARKRAFLEFANFLEVQAAALNGNLYPRVTREIVREKLWDSLAVIESAEPWFDELMAAKSSPTTFKHLLRFRKKERRRIDKVKALQEQLLEEQDEPAQNIEAPPVVEAQSEGHLSASVPQPMK